MSLYLSAYTKALRSYDRDLFAGLTKDGKPCVFRRSKRYEPVWVTDEFSLLNLITDKQFVFAITHNWMATGEPRDWGIDDVLNKVKKSDALANKALFDEMDAANEKVDAIKKKDIRNNIESFWIDERKRFAKATDDILTHSLSKDEPKRRLKDRSIKNGNY